MKTRFAILAALLCLSSWTQAADDSDTAWPVPDPAVTEAAERYRLELAEALSVSQQPRELMLSAQLTALHEAMSRPVDSNGVRQGPRRADPEVDALVAEALRLGTDDPLLWWMVATGCPGSAAVCDPSAAVQRLRRLDPDNGAVWLLEARGEGRLGSLPSAAAMPDQERLDRIAAASHYDSFYAEGLRTTYAAFAAVPVPAELMTPAAHGQAAPTPEQARFMMAAGVHLAGFLPSFSNAEALCGKATMLSGSEARRGRCRAAFGQVLLQADTAATLSLAIGQLRRLEPPGPERDAVELERRRLIWQMSAWGELQLTEDGAVEDAQLDALNRAWLAPGATELGIMRDGLRDAGISLEPPPDWRGSFWSDAED